MAQKTVIVKPTRWFNGEECYLHTPSKPFYYFEDYKEERVKLELMGYRVHEKTTHEGILIYKSHRPTEWQKNKMAQKYANHEVEFILKKHKGVRTDFYYEILEKQKKKPKSSHK